MDQFQLGVDEILHSDLTDAQLLAVLKIKALTAQLESAPTVKQIARFVSQKTINNLHKIDPTLIELETNSTLTQVERVIKKRGYSKTKMRQLREKQESVTGNLPESYSTLNKIKENNIKKDTNVSKKEREVINYEWIENLWSELTEIAPEIKPITRMTETRKRKIKARINSSKDFYEELKKACQNIIESDYLRGKIKNWTITFDWLIEKESNFTKVLEGNYNNGKQNSLFDAIDECERKQAAIQEYVASIRKEKGRFN